MRLRLAILVRHPMLMRHPVLVRAGFTGHRHWRGRCESTRTDEGECDKDDQERAQQFPHHVPNLTALFLPDQPQNGDGRVAAGRYSTSLVSVHIPARQLTSGGKIRVWLGVKCRLGCSETRRKPRLRNRLGRVKPGQGQRRASSGQGFANSSPSGCNAGSVGSDQIDRSGSASIYGFNSSGGWAR